MRKSVAADIRTIFNADSFSYAQERLAVLIQKYSNSAPQLSAWMETAIPEGLTVFNLPEHKRKRLRTSNRCETLNTQIKRRTFSKYRLDFQTCYSHTYRNLRRMGDR